MTEPLTEDQVNQLDALANVIEDGMCGGCVHQDLDPIAIRAALARLDILESENQSLHNQLARLLDQLGATD